MHSCTDQRRCPLRISTWLFLFSALASLYHDARILAACNGIVFITSYLRYYAGPCCTNNSKRRHVIDTVDNVAVPVATATLFLTQPVAIVPLLCLAYNAPIFCLKSVNDCYWHVTVHVGAFIGTMAWLWRL